MNKKSTRNVTNEYFKSLHNDVDSSLAWCFICIQRSLAYLMLCDKNKFREACEDPLIKHLLSYVQEFQLIMNKETEEMNKK